MRILYLIFAGLISGIIGGMGMGGGTLLIPILTIFLFFEQKSAQAINLLAFIPMSLIALFIHIKNKLVDFKVGLPIIATGIFFSIGGSYLASIINNEVLKKIFAVFLLIVGVNQCIQTIVFFVKSKKKPTKQYKIKVYFK